MTARTVCPAVYAGLIGTALIATPTSAYALNLQSITQQSPTGNPLTDGVLWMGAGILVGGAAGLCIHGAKAAYVRISEKNNVAEINDVSDLSVAATESPAKAQYTPRHMKQPSAQTNVHTRTHAADHPHVSSAHAGKHSNEAVSLEQLADNYVKKEQYKHKKSIRSQGVAFVLAQRLGFTTASFMEGIPVIERADGTVGDVGTTWWDEAVVDKRRSGEGFTDYLNIQGNWSATALLEDPKAELVPAQSSQVVSESASVEVDYRISDLDEVDDLFATPSVVVAQGTEDLDEIDDLDVVVATASAQPSSQIELKPVPQIAAQTPTHSAEQPKVAHETFSKDSALENASKEEIWKIALEAMEENIEHDVMSHKMDLVEENPFEIDRVIEFEDVIGGDDSLDDPDDLEQKTCFIPFKAPVGHPEVVDTDSYIDYLIKSEQERLESRRVKKKSRKHLKVIEGGTSQFTLCGGELYNQAKEA